MGKAKIEEYKCNNGETLKWDKDYTIRPDHNNKKVMAIHLEFPDQVNTFLKAIKSQANNKTAFERDLKASYGIVEVVASDTTPTQDSKTKARIDKYKAMVLKHTQAGETDDQIKAIMRAKKVPETDITLTFKTEKPAESEDIDF